MLYPASADLGDFLAPGIQNKLAFEQGTSGEKLAEAAGLSVPRVAMSTRSGPGVTARVLTMVATPELSGVVGDGFVSRQKDLRHPAP